MVLTGWIVTLSRRSDPAGADDRHPSAFIVTFPELENTAIEDVAPMVSASFAPAVKVTLPPRIAARADAAVRAGSVEDEEVVVANSRNATPSVAAERVRHDVGSAVDHDVAASRQGNAAVGVHVVVVIGAYRAEQDILPGREGDAAGAMQ